MQLENITKLKRHFRTLKNPKESLRTPESCVRKNGDVTVTEKNVIFTVYVMCFI